MRGFRKKYEETDEDEYLRFNHLPDYRNYDCKDVYHCTSKTNDFDREIIEGKIPDYQIKAILLSIADIDNDGIADATIFLEGAVHGRVNPGTLLIYTRLSNEESAIVLDVFPPWPTSP